MYGFLGGDESYYYPKVRIALSFPSLPFSSRVWIPQWSHLSLRPRNSRGGKIGLALASISNGTFWFAPCYDLLAASTPTKKREDGSRAWQAKGLRDDELGVRCPRARFRLNVLIGIGACFTTGSWSGSASMHTTTT